MSPCSKMGFWRRYIKKASDDQRPIIWMQSRGVPAIASAVAPPDRSEWPATSSLGKMLRRCDMNQEWVGTWPSHLSHSSGRWGNRRSQCRWDNNLPHESFVESDSRARMSYHNHPKSRLHSIT